MASENETPRPEDSPGRLTPRERIIGIRTERAAEADARAAAQAAEDRAPEMRAAEARAAAARETEAWAAADAPTVPVSSVPVSGASVTEAQAAEVRRENVASEARVAEADADAVRAREGADAPATRAAETRAVEARAAEGRAAETAAVTAAAAGAVAPEVASRTFGSEPEAPAPQPVSRTQRRLLGFTWLAVFGMAAYALFMGLAFFQPGYTLGDRIASIFFLLAFTYIMLHSLGYANSMLKGAWGYREMRRRAFSPQRLPKVACVVATFNEPPSVVEETVAALANLDYPNKEITVLDDSTNENARQAVREIAARYGVGVVQRTNRRGYKAGAINDFLPTSDAQYVAVFDADALPAHNFLRDIVPIIDENPRLAFVQTPQYYANADVSNVAMAAARQQAVFYEYICEGKNYSRAAFCCGTNVVFRRDALLAVGGFDEKSVTEDFVTSIALHQKGYDSTYYNQVYVYSMAPETLGAYFTQQARWALGSVGAGRRVLGGLFTRPGSLRGGQWWEYFLSSTYYWCGWVNFILMVLPLLYIFFGVKPLHADVFTYLMVFLPYLLFTMNMFYAGMEDRGYRVGEMILGQQLNFLCFPVHMSAALAGLFGKRRPFGVTPKGESGRVSWLSLWFPLLMLILSAAGFIWGMLQYLRGVDRATSAIVINAVWAFYHVFLLSGIFRLNRRVAARRTEAYFGTGQPVPAGAVATTDGRVLRRPLSAPPRRPAGRWALLFSILSLVLLIAAGLTMFNWYRTPGYPVNVTILDRTTGRDYQEHRALAWTLNFLKVRKQPDFQPYEAGAEAGKSADHTNYKFAEDFAGHVPGPLDTAEPDELYNPDKDLKVRGTDRPLPASLQAPGVLYLADTYGEFVEFDYRRQRFVRYYDEPRGIKPPDVAKIEDFANRGGLVLAEWNTIGYPTLPASFVEPNSLAEGIKSTQQGLQFLLTIELPQRQAQLQKANATTSVTFQNLARTQVVETQDKINRSKAALADLQRLQQELGPKLAERATQLKAQRQLEKLLHVHYKGWYGRYVDHFEQEHEYDFRLWKKVSDYLANHKDVADKMGFKDNRPQGAGFVFFRDGDEKVVNVETGKLEDNPFAQPVVIFQAELGEGRTTDVAGIYANSQLKDDPLLRDVAAQVPCRYWFDVVQAEPGSQILSVYKLRIKTAAVQRLQEAKFAALFSPDEKDKDTTVVVFPAAVAYRDGGANGALRSLYLAGDASDYPLVSRISEMVPASGGIAYFLGGRTGPFPMQFYWNYYQPILRNVFESTPQVRYEGGAGNPPAGSVGQPQ